ERRERVLVAPPAARDGVELVLHLGGEAEVEEGGEVGHEEVAHAHAEVGGVELPRPELGVAALLDRRQRLAVGARPADALLFERLHERGLGVAWRWLRL